jgi:rRNA maturation RNase YbeY
LLLKQFITHQFFIKTGKKIKLNIVFCSDDFLLKINQHFLQHDDYTDIITFPLEETERKTVAEIYISLDRVWDNAQNQKVTFENELLRVMFHGVIHLTGVNDKTTAEKQQMREEENKWLNAFYRQQNG